MAYDIPQRFRSAGELRDAVWNWLSDEPLSAILSTVKHFEDLVRQQPEVKEFRIRLSRELTSLSKVYQSLNRNIDAVRASERAAELLSDIAVEGNPVFKPVKNCIWHESNCRRCSGGLMKLNARTKLIE